ncbi:DUF4148 domain-containing protein [Paraburkholderia sp. C35]|uniref:DUF4148 domain-containing protein n=1 Tax=Paraburkholderia sp. C35 TaxID=2126993 RepID=UPI000D687A24|nr:DUF4148 domain-containing protein [Paraburkholderia sp. C35]
MHIVRKLNVLLISTLLGIGTVGAAFAQTAPAAGAMASSPSPTKAQRKQARKEARAKKNAELKKLEDAGYQPGRASDPNYPQDIQDAEKKAGIGQGTNQ